MISKLKKINEEPNHLAVQRTNIREVFEEVLPQFKPMFEDAGSLLRRAAVIRSFYREYLRMYPLQEGYRHAIVCHSQIMATLTASGEDANDVKGLKDYVWTKNCQLLPYNNEKLNQDA